MTSTQRRRAPQPAKRTPATKQIAKSPVETMLVTRFAVALLRVPSDATISVADNAEARIREALTADPRVHDIHEDRGSVGTNALLLEFSEIQEGASQDAFSLAVTHFKVLRLNGLLRFTVSVPIKNQPKYRNIDDAPSEVYEVAWNGVVLAVQWQQSARRAPAASGGHVVFDVLSAVALAAGYSLVVQACTPDCEHRFIHADLCSLPGEPPDQYSLLSKLPTGAGVQTPIPASAGPDVALPLLFSDLAAPVQAYAELTDVGLRLWETEWAARSANLRLLALNYARASRSSLLTVPGIRARWQMKGSRRAARTIIAQLWLYVSAIENDSRRWSSRYHTLTAEWSRRNIKVIFDEAQVDAEHIQSLDLGLLRSALMDAAGRLDSNTLAVATTASALAALAGAAIGRFG